MTNTFVLRSIVSHSENEISAEVHKDILGCECSVSTKDFFNERSLVIFVEKSNSGRVRNIMTSAIESVETTDMEVVVETRNSVYTFTKLK